MLAVPSRPRARAWPYAALAVLFLIASLAVGRDARDRFNEILHGAEIAGEPFEIDPMTRTVSRLAPEAQAAGLHDGDVVLAIAGRPFEGLATTRRRSDAPGQAIASPYAFGRGRWRRISADTFVASAPQHDDMTLVVVRAR